MSNRNLNDMQFASTWASEYQASPVANREVTSLIRQFPPTPEHHELYGKLMNNVADHHAQEWFKAGDSDEHHESTYHLTTNLRDAHHGLSEIRDLL